MGRPSASSTAGAGNTFIGIDPGLKGAVAALTADGRLLHLSNLPAKGREYQIDALADLLSSLSPAVVAVEVVHPLPGEGRVSSFRLGYGLGLVLGVCAALGNRITLVDPRVWKRHHELTGQPKAASLDRARQLYPEHAAQITDHNRAEALLIAVWLRDVNLAGKRG